MEKEAKMPGGDGLEGAESLVGEVTISITGVNAGIRKDCEGQCYYRNGHVFALFQEEYEETVFSSRLKVSPDQVILRRSLPGKEEKSAGTVMEFIYRRQEADEPGCFVDYPSPYGSMRLEVRTKELFVEKKEGELYVFVRYLLLQEGQEIHEEELRISLKRKGSRA